MANPNNPKWSELSGRDVAIKTPAFIGDPGEFVCGGPLYEAVRQTFMRNGVRWVLCVCPHTAEIGD